MKKARDKGAHSKTQHRSKYINSYTITNNPRLRDLSSLTGTPRRNRYRLCWVLPGLTRPPYKLRTSRSPTTNTYEISFESHRDSSQVALWTLLSLTRSFITHTTTLPIEHKGNAQERQARQRFRENNQDKEQTWRNNEATGRNKNTEPSNDIRYELCWVYPGTS